jgi:hypothetical protein
MFVITWDLKINRIFGINKKKNLNFFSSKILNNTFTYSIDINYICTTQNNLFSAYNGLAYAGMDS